MSQLQNSSVCHPRPREGGEHGDPGKRWTKKLFLEIKNKNPTKAPFCQIWKKFVYFKE